MHGAVLITGATGFVGMEVMARYLERTDRDVYVLVRASDDAGADERVREVLSTIYADPDAYPGRVTAVAADIERSDLGLPPERRAELVARVSDVVHAAATVSFTLPLEESRTINVEGTRRMLELAMAAQARFAYVSTAYVAGTHEGEFREDQFDVGQDFRNAYERSKFEAERLVREHAGRLPVQIFRPSIIVGERETGWTSSFNVLYEPLKAFARGALPALPANRSTRVDVVPVDWVADAIFALATGPVEAEAETFHLVSGRDATTVGTLIEIGARHFDRPPPRVLPPRLYRRVLHPVLVRVLKQRRRRALERTEAFFPYYTMRVQFDDRRTRERLDPHGISVGPVDSYLHKLIEFGKAADWGRRPVRRELRPSPSLSTNGAGPASARPRSSGSSRATPAPS